MYFCVYIQPYVKKGSLVYIEGSLKTDKWQDKDGNDKYSTGVVLNNFGGIQILGGGEGGGYERAGGMDQTPKTSEENTSQVTEDDLPF